MVAILFGIRCTQFPNMVLVANALIERYVTGNTSFSVLCVYVFMCVSVFVYVLVCLCVYVC